MNNLPKELVDELQSEMEASKAATMEDVAPAEQEQKVEVKEEVSTETQATTETVVASEEKKEEAKPEALVASEAEIDDADSYIDSLFTNTSETPTEKKEEAPVEEKKEVVVDERQKALEEALKDPATQWLLDMRAQGKDPFEEIAKINTSDPNKYSAVDIYKMKLEELKATGNYTEDQIEDYLERFQDKDPLEQESTVSVYRDKMVKDWNAARESLKPTIDPVEAQKKQEEYWNQINAKANEDFTSFEKTAKGTNFYGLEWTEDRLNAVKKTVFDGDPNSIIVTAQDGSVDMKRTIEVNATQMFLKDIIKSVVTKTKNGVKKEVIQERHNTSPDSTTRQPANAELSPMEAYLEAEARKRNS